MNPLKRDVERLEKENNELHFQIIKLKEESESKDIKWSTAHSSLEEQKKDIKFLLGQKENEILSLRSENDSFKSKVAELVAKLYFPSKGVAMKSAPKELIDSVLSKEHNSIR